MSDVLHYDSSIVKIDKDGNEVLSNTLGPGEKLKSGVTYEDLTGGRETLGAAENSGGAAFLTPAAAEEVASEQAEAAAKDAEDKQKASDEKNEQAIDSIPNDDNDASDEQKQAAADANISPKSESQKADESTLTVSESNPANTAGKDSSDAKEVAGDGKGTKS